MKLRFDTFNKSSVADLDVVERRLGLSSCRPGRTTSALSTLPPLIDYHIGALSIGHHVAGAQVLI